MNKLILAGAGLAAALSSAAIAQVPQGYGRGDGVQTRAEVVQHVQAMFARLDTNRDGFVTQAEVQAAGGRFRAQQGARANDPARQQQRNERAFERLDTNRDGAITRDEMAARQGGRGQHQMRAGGGMGMGMIGRMFAMADANRDNRVSLQEATAAALQHFDRADLNRDGQVTRDERQQMRQQFRGQPPVRG